MYPSCVCRLNIGKNCEEEKRLTFSPGAECTRLVAGECLCSWDDVVAGHCRVSVKLTMRKAK